MGSSRIIPNKQMLVGVHSEHDDKWQLRLEKSTNFGSTKINFAKLRSDGKSLGIIFTYLKSVKIIDTRKKSF